MTIQQLRYVIKNRRVRLDHGSGAAALYIPAQPFGGSEGIGDGTRD